MSTMMDLVLEKTAKLGSVFSTCKSLPAFFGYLLMIFTAGLWIKISKPLKLRNVLILYNFMCTAISAYTILLFGLAYTDPNLPYIFQRNTTPAFEKAFLVYHILKWIEMLDTVFMILRHRQRQISFLHVFHHSSMLLLSDVAYNGYPWPSIAFYMTLNSFVHVWLYLYYALSAAYPENPPQWKKQMTQLQIFQFFVGFLYSGYGYLYHNFCVYGPLYGIILTILFCNFYYQAYIKKRPSNLAKKDVRKAL